VDEARKEEPRFLPAAPFAQEVERAVADPLRRMFLGGVERDLRDVVHFAAGSLRFVAACAALGEKTAVVVGVGVGTALLLNQPGVEAAPGQLVRREVAFADRCRMVAERVERGGQRIALIRRHGDIVRHASPGGVAPVVHRAAGGHADRGGGVGRGKRGSLVDQPVEVRGSDHRVAERVNGVEALHVGEEEEDIRFPVHQVVLRVKGCGLTAGISASTSLLQLRSSAWSRAVVSGSASARLRVSEMSERRW